MGQNAVLTPGSALEEAARSVAAALAAYHITNHSAEIRTPFIAPSGMPITIVLHPHDGAWMVHDDGVGALEAEMSGALGIYLSIARGIAVQAGLGFDQRMVFCAKVEQDWLPNAVIAEADAVRTSLMRTAEKQAAQIASAARTILFSRLDERFGAKFVGRDVEISGAAGAVWTVDAAIMSAGRSKRAVCEIVSPHPNSVAAAYTKLSDIGAVEAAPVRVAVKQKTMGFDAPKIALLSRASSIVVDLDTPIDAWIAMAA